MTEADPLLPPALAVIVTVPMALATARVVFPDDWHGNVDGTVARICVADADTTCSGVPLTLTATPSAAIEKLEPTIVSIAPGVIISGETDVTTGVDALPNPVTRPVGETEALVGSEEVQVIVSPVTGRPFSSVTVVESCSVPPVTTTPAGGVTNTPDRETTKTVMASAPVRPPLV